MFCWRAFFFFGEIFQILDHVFLPSHAPFPKIASDFLIPFFSLHSGRSLPPWSGSSSAYFFFQRKSAFLPSPRAPAFFVEAISFSGNLCSLPLFPTALFWCCAPRQYPFFFETDIPFFPLLLACVGEGFSFFPSLFPHSRDLYPRGRLPFTFFFLNILLFFFLREISLPLPFFLSIPRVRRSLHRKSPLSGCSPPLVVDAFFFCEASGHLFSPPYEARQAAPFRKLIPALFSNSPQEEMRPPSELKGRRPPLKIVRNGTP